MIRKVVLAGVTSGSLLLAACSLPSSTADTESPAVSRDAEKAIDDLQGKILSKGPNGETAAPASSAVLTPEEVAKVREMDATAAIALHYGGNDWATGQIDGLEAEFDHLGIEVIAETDADFSPDLQVTQLETLLTQDPDVIVSIPTDPLATASAYQEVADAGVKLVFMDNPAAGLKAGTDYASVVSADNYGNGVVSAHLTAKALGGQGEIGVIYHNVDFFVTDQRYQGFKTTITEDYPDIKIVEESGIIGPDFAVESQSIANAMLAQHPDLAGIWAVWDVPAEGVMAAARSSGRLDLQIATEDLGTNAAIALAQDELVVGLGAQRPYDQGVTEARLAAAALLGKKTPPYVAVSALPVEHANVLDAWKAVYHEPPPDDLQESFEQALDLDDAAGDGGG